MTTAGCLELGSCPLLKKGKKAKNTNQNIKAINMVKNGNMGVFGMYGLYIWLYLFFQDVLDTFLKYHGGYCRFSGVKHF